MEHGSPPTAAGWPAWGTKRPSRPWAGRPGAPGPGPGQIAAPGHLGEPANPAQADYVALQWHREFRDREPETWNAFGTGRPATGLYLDEVPQVIVYARPGLPGAP